MKAMVEQAKQVLMEDRSSAEVDDKCGMRYWFYKLEGGTGIVPKKEALALAIGRETHEDLKTLAEMEDISPEALQEAIDGILQGLSEEDVQFRKEMELLYRRLGWFAAWGLYAEPRVRELYEDIAVEKEIILDRDELWVPCTPDRVLRAKGGGQIIYQEYKTALYADFKWQQSWRYAIQLHIGIQALQEELEKKVHFARVVGLLKGTYRDDRLHHPYVWGYYNHREDKWSCEYKSGMDWVPMPVWEYPGGVVAWVQFCGSEVARSQFPHSAPVFLDERMLDEWVRRRTRRQKVVQVFKSRAQVDLKMRGNIFERRTNQCRPAFGPECPYLMCCWNAEAELDPLKSGDFVPREPHHELEMIGVE